MPVSTGRTVPAGWWSQVRTASRRWHELVPADNSLPPHWRPGIEAAARQRYELLRSHRWHSGPVDLMEVLGVREQEVAHSKAIAWLCDPTASHGFGASFLLEFLRRIAPGSRAVDRVNEEAESDAFLLQTSVSTEVCVGSAATDDAGRVDVVVSTNTLRLIIENKVGAPIHGSQLHTYASHYKGIDTDRRQVLLVLLSLRPTPSMARQARQARYHMCSYREHLLPALQSAMRDRPSEAAGRHAAEAYLRSLEELR